MSWKTKTAAILTALYAVIGVGLYFIGGPEATGALSPMVALPVFLGALGMFGLRDAITKALGK